MPLANPGPKESMRKTRRPRGRICVADVSSENVHPFAGGMSPEKVPVAVSIAGYGARGLRATLSSPYIPCTMTAFVTLPLVRGVTDFTYRGDSSELGPDRIELMSNAVTE